MMYAMVAKVIDGCNISSRFYRTTGTKNLALTRMPASEQIETSTQNPLGREMEVRLHRHGYRLA